MAFCKGFADTVVITCVMLWDPVKRLYRTCFPKSKKSVKGEIILLTGAGHGLGKALALKLAKLGPILVLWDINEEGNNAVAAEIRSMGHPVHAFKVDVTNLADVSEAARRVREEVGDVTIVINNAGVFSGYPLVDAPEHIVRLCFGVNVIGHFWILQQFLPRMIELNKGHVVAIASAGGHIGTAYMTDYCASKFAAVGLMDSLYVELRGNKHKIKLTTINPLIIATGLISNTKTRFPSLMPVLDVEQTANQVLKSILTEADEVFIPKRVHWLMAYRNMFSRNTRFKMFQYLGYGFDSKKHINTKGYVNTTVEEV